MLDGIHVPVSFCLRLLNDASVNLPLFLDLPLLSACNQFYPSIVVFVLKSSFPSHEKLTGHQYGGILSMNVGGTYETEALFIHHYCHYDRPALFMRAAKQYDSGTGILNTYDKRNSLNTGRKECQSW